MAEFIKTIKEMEDIFRIAVLNIFQISPNSKEGQSRVRFPWGSGFENKSGSMPVWKRDEDVCIIYELPQDDAYNRQRDISYKNHENGMDIIRIDEHTDVHYLMFVNYGPNAYEFARDLRDGLNRESIKELFKKNNFFPVPDFPAIKRVPELINGQWWNRVDFTAVFYEYVRREETIKTIENVNIEATAVSKGKELTEHVKSEN